MKLSRGVHVVLSILVGILTVLGLFEFLGTSPQMARADPETLFASVSGSDTASCMQVDPCSLQTALDNATDGDTIYVGAGIVYDTGKAVVIVTKSVILKGGWDGSTATPPVHDPEVYPTTLDGENERRGVFISGNITPTPTTQQALHT